MQANSGNVIDTISLLDSEDEKDRDASPLDLQRNKSLPSFNSLEPPRPRGFLSCQNKSPANHSSPRASSSGVGLPSKYEWTFQDARWKMLNCSLNDRRNSQPVLGNTTLSVTQYNLDFEAHQTFEDLRAGSRSEQTELKNEVSVPFEATINQPALPRIRTRSQSPPAVPAKLPKLTTKEPSDSCISSYPRNLKFHEDCELDSVNWMPAYPYHSEIQFPLSQAKCCKLSSKEETLQQPDSSILFPSYNILEKEELLKQSDKLDSDFSCVESKILNEEKVIFFNNEMEMQSHFISSTTNTHLNEQKGLAKENKHEQEDETLVDLPFKSECEKTAMDTHLDEKTSFGKEKEYGQKGEETVNLQLKSGYEEIAADELSSISSVSVSAYCIADCNDSASEIVDSVGAFSRSDANDVSTNCAASSLGEQIKDDKTGTMREPLLVVKDTPERNIYTEEMLLDSVLPDDSKSSCRRRELEADHARKARKRIIKKFMMVSNSNSKESWGTWLRKKLRFTRVAKTLKTERYLTGTVNLKRVLKPGKLALTRSRRDWVTQSVCGNQISNPVPPSHFKLRKEDKIDDNRALIEGFKTPEVVNPWPGLNALHSSGGGGDSFNIWDDFDPLMPLLIPQVPLVLSSFISHSPVDVRKKEGDHLSAVYTNAEDQEIKHLTSCNNVEKHSEGVPIPSGEIGSESSSEVSSAEASSSAVSDNTGPESVSIKTERTSSSISKDQEKGTSSSTSQTSSLFEPLSTRPRGRVRKNLKRQITPASRIILDEFLKANGDTPIPSELVDLSGKTGLLTSVIRNWFKSKKRELELASASSLDNANKTYSHKCHVTPPVIVPACRKKRIPTITLSSDAEGDIQASLPNSTVRTVRKNTPVEESLGAFNRLSLDEFKHLHASAKNWLLTIADNRTGDSASFDRIEKDTAHLQEILCSFSIFTEDQRRRLDLWLLRDIQEYKEEANEPDDDDVQDLTTTLIPWRLVAMYAKYTHQSMRKAIEGLEQAVGSDRYSWKVPDWVDGEK